MFEDENNDMLRDIYEKYSVQSVQVRINNSFSYYRSLPKEVRCIKKKKKKR